MKQPGGCPLVLYEAPATPPIESGVLAVLIAPLAASGSIHRAADRQPTRVPVEMVPS